jgi:hypothetical protein
VRANKGFVQDLKQILTKDGYEKLASEVSMVVSQRSDIRAEDECGLSFTYGDYMVQCGEGDDVEAWLGLLECVDDED